MLRAGRSSVCAAIILGTLAVWLEPTEVRAQPPPVVDGPDPNGYWAPSSPGMLFAPASPGLPPPDDPYRGVVGSSSDAPFDQKLMQLWNLWFRDAVHNYTWLPGGGDDLGFTDLAGQFTIRHPWPIPLTIRPVSVRHLVNGPSSTDLPSQLYEASLDLALKGPIRDGWVLEVAIRPGLFGDFHRVNSDTVRIQGRVIATKQVSETTELVLGFVYLDREDVAALPAVGVNWRPTPDSLFELVLPRPKIAQRILQHGNMERWIYVAGEFGGNSWQIERAAGTPDVATYRDFRVIAGIETLVAGGLSTWAEAGYVFGRKLTYESNTPQLESPDALMLRLGFKF